jgi:hypothetical protein
VALKQEFIYIRNFVKFSGSTEYSAKTQSFGCSKSQAIKGPEVLVVDTRLNPRKIFRLLITGGTFEFFDYSEFRTSGFKDQGIKWAPDK